MRAAVYGIGYVGAVVAACLADRGHDVIAVDVSVGKVDAINEGRSPLAEPGLPEMIAAGLHAGRLRATIDAEDGFRQSDVLFVCVGTPAQANGRPDLSYTIGIAEQFGAMLKTCADGRRRTFVFRSTLLPGTMDDMVIPVLERASGLRAGIDFGLGYNPEFLREGQGIDDFMHPNVTVLGGSDPASFLALREFVPTGDGPSNGHVFECDLRTAEAIKFANNAWHAVKVGFANEIGAVCRASGVDGRQVMNILCADTKLNISRHYLRPGFAFGGSCLPKDLKALVYHGGARDVQLPLLSSILPSNALHIGRTLDIIQDCGSKHVLLLGLTFKPDTDDLRDSPFVELAERLIGKGYQLSIFDPSFSYDSLTGQNRKFIQTALPHVASLLVPSLQAGLDAAYTVIVGHRNSAFENLATLATDRHTVVDLVGAPALAGLPRYRGVCW